MPRRAAGFTTRSVFNKRSLPSTLDEASRSLEVVGTTSDKVKVFDWELWRTVDEVLLMSGFRAPDSGQVPLLNTHSRFGVGEVLGSYRELRAANDHLLGRVYFSAVREADDAFTKVREGHLTDYSVGYNILAYEEINEDAVVERDGLTIEGPCRLVTEWQLQELSICPIGADPRAKGRAFVNSKEDYMTKNTGRREEQKPEDQEDELDTEDRDSNEMLPDDEENQDEERNEAEDEEERTDNDDEDETEERGKKRARAERSRVVTIDRMCREFNMPDNLRSTLIAKGTTVNQAREEIMKRMAGEYKKGPAFGARIVDERDKFRAAAQSALFMRCGLSVPKPAPGSDELRGFSLRELARECVIRSGGRPGSDSRDMVQRALTTTDLPMLLAETTNRSLLAGYEEAEETWHLWTDEGSAQDFKTQKLVGYSIDNSLDEVGEHEEYSFGEMLEEGESYQLSTYGKKFAVTRQSIINDDLGALADIPRAYGEGAKRKIGDAVYGILIGNSKMNDGTPLFHVNHKNAFTGKGGVPTVDTLGAVVTSMGLQTDPYGRKLNIKPEYFIAPLALSVGAETFFNSQLIGTAAQPNVPNIFAGKYQRVFDGRLDDDSPLTWYLQGNKRRGIKVIWLNGEKHPYLETREGWDIDGLEYKVRIDMTVVASSWRHLCRASE